MSKNVTVCGSQPLVLSIKKLINGATKTSFVSSNDEDHISFYREKAEQAHAASGVLSSLLVNHAIYFDEPTYKQIADFSSESAFAVADFLRVIRKSSRRKKPGENWDRISSFVSPPAFNGMKDEPLGIDGDQRKSGHRVHRT